MANSEQEGLLHEIKTVDTSRDALQSFGRTVGGVFLTLAAFLWWYTGAPGVVEYATGGVGAALVVLGILAPIFLRPIYRGWMAVALVLGFVMNRVLLSLVFFGLVTPIGLLAKMVGRDPMRRTLDPDTDSYWISKEYRSQVPNRLEKYY